MADKDFWGSVGDVALTGLSRYVDTEIAARQTPTIQGGGYVNNPGEPVRKEGTTDNPDNAPTMNNKLVYVAGALLAVVVVVVVAKAVR